jgi:hypothetical protein
MKKEILDFTGFVGGQFALTPTGPCARFPECAKPEEFQRIPELGRVGPHPARTLTPFTS